MTIKEQKGVPNMLLGTLSVSLLRNMLSRKVYFCG